MNYPSFDYVARHHDHIDATNETHPITVNNIKPLRGHRFGELAVFGSVTFEQTPTLTIFIESCEGCMQVGGHPLEIGALNVKLHFCHNKLEGGYPQPVLFFHITMFGAKQAATAVQMIEMMWKHSEHDGIDREARPNGGTTIATLPTTNQA